mmetsp:Transcript_30888/g.65731  ORF Transcript_30888/g.65731 Transcript_30888/m.65731 type:complete len:200 (-) Transcript_30888:121-720(-)
MIRYDVEQFAASPRSLTSACVRNPSPRVVRRGGTRADLLPLRAGEFDPASTFLAAAIAIVFPNARRDFLLPSAGWSECESDVDAAAAPLDVASTWIIPNERTEKTRGQLCVRRAVSNLAARIRNRIERQVQDVRRDDPRPSRNAAADRLLRSLVRALQADEGAIEIREAAARRTGTAASARRRKRRRRRRRRPGGSGGG